MTDETRPPTPYPNAPRRRSPQGENLLDGGFVPELPQIEIELEDSPEQPETVGRASVWGWLQKLVRPGRAAGDPPPGHPGVEAASQALPVAGEETLPLTPTPGEGASEDDDPGAERANAQVEAQISQFLSESGWEGDAPSGPFYTQPDDELLPEWMRDLPPTHPLDAGELDGPQNASLPAGAPAVDQVTESEDSGAASPFSIELPPSNDESFWDEFNDQIRAREQDLQSLQDSFEPLPSWNGNTVNPFTEDSPHHPEAQDGDGDSTAPLHLGPDGWEEAPADDDLASRMSRFSFAWDDEDPIPAIDQEPSGPLAAAEAAPETHEEDQFFTHPLGTQYLDPSQVEEPSGAAQAPVRVPPETTPELPAGLPELSATLEAQPVTGEEPPAPVPGGGETREPPFQPGAWLDEPDWEETRQQNAPPAQNA
ncbi:MAG: hypothetical protein GYA17_03815, partial [Chloroflexi bacterium]|nr:hypothetical protein [Chloroflexota bacterium]